METQYAFIFDIITVALIVGMLFAGAKKGFASAVISAAAVIVAFACAMSFSSPITQSLYKAIVEEPLEKAVDEKLDEAMSAVSLRGISSLDYEAVLVSGTRADEVELDYGGTGKVIVDLTSLDLSKTGIAQADLSAFGVLPDTDFTNVSAKTAEFTRADIEEHGLGKMAFAQYLAVCMQGSDFLEPFTEFTEQIGETLPVIFGNKAQSISNGSADALRSVVLVMLETSVNAKEAVIGGIIEPCFIMIMRNVVFVVIFVAVIVALGVLASLLKFVNKLPVLGKFNVVAGALLGAAEGAVAVFVVCLIVRMIVSLTGGNMMLLNEMAIEETYLFRFFYNLDFLNFLT